MERLLLVQGRVEHDGFFMLGWSKGKVAGGRKLQSHHDDYDAAVGWHE
jgi:hypothetical protein